WGGNPSNVYDTTRAASLGSSSGSAVSVSANLVMCSLGEETRASTRGPANHNSVALILPHKAMLGFNGGAIGADIYCDRSGIMARTIADCAKVLDALRNPDGGYYDPRDPYTTVPRSSVLPSYTEHARASGSSGALKGMRIGVIRESMLVGPDGTPLFQEFAAAIRPTEFMPGKVFGGGTMLPIDYLVALAEGHVAPPANLDIATIQEQQLAPTFRYHIPHYLGRRAADWKARGFTETLTDFAALNARSKFWGDDGRAAFKNWEEVSDPRNPLGGRQGVDERIMLRELLRRLDMLVMLENRLDALVRLHTPLPPGKIGGAHDALAGPSNLRAETMYG